MKYYANKSYLDQLPVSFIIDDNPHLKTFSLNRHFAQSGHMEQNHICWDGSINCSHSPILLNIYSLMEK